jgi:hypothetical protein
LPDFQAGCFCLNTRKTHLFTDCVQKIEFSLVGKWAKIKGSKNSKEALALI